MNLKTYWNIRTEIIRRGYEHEIDWAESLQPVDCPDVFFSEYAWVVCNSGMPNQVARIIWDRIKTALQDGKPVISALGHKGKASGIQYVFDHRQELFKAYLTSEDKLVFIRELPWIGPISTWHLAKNYGMDVVKPDRHLQRISTHYQTKTEDLCKTLSIGTGDRIATVDYVLWRAANLGLWEKLCPVEVNSKS